MDLNNSAAGVFRIACATRDKRKDHVVYPRVDDVILTLVPRGTGDAKDPCRTVIQVHQKDGLFIAENDPSVDVDRMRRRIDIAERLLRYLRDKHEALGDADRER